MGSETNLDPSLNEYQPGLSDSREQELSKVRAVIEKLGGIQQALKKISQGSISRTSLTAAVREALHQILEGDKQELFPELRELQAGIELLGRASGEGLEKQKSELEGQLGAVRERSEKGIESFQAWAQDRFGQLENRLAALESQFQEQLRGLEKIIRELGESVKILERSLDGRWAGDFAQLESKLEEKFEKEIQSVEASLAEKIASLEMQIADQSQGGGSRAEELLQGLNRAVEEFRAFEARINKEVAVLQQESMIEIKDQIRELAEMVGSLPGLLPPRRLFETIEDRLEQVEEKFKLLSSQLRQVEEFVPELKSARERFKALQEQIANLTAEIVTAEREVVDFREQTAQKLAQVQELLKKGLDRHDLDRSLVGQRILNLRDTLKGQLESAIERSRSSKGSLWNRLSGHRESGPLQLEPEEWERFRSRLESVLEGLESLIADYGGRF
ncbi:MAG: hypothetical protein HY717_03780 [Planctomycetes bacterium]|nr:hypothetical protein [Planctomycetota bacterium]